MTSPATTTCPNCAPRGHADLATKAKTVRMTAAEENRSTSTAMGDIAATASAPTGKPIAYVRVTVEAVDMGMRGKSMPPSSPRPTHAVQRLLAIAIDHDF